MESASSIFPMPLPNPPSPLIAWLMAEVRLDDTLVITDCIASCIPELIFPIICSIAVWIPFVSCFSTCSIISVNFDSIPFAIASVKEVIMTFM